MLARLLKLEARLVSVSSGLGRQLRCCRECTLSWKKRELVRKARKRMSAQAWADSYGFAGVHNLKDCKSMGVAHSVAVCIGVHSVGASMGVHSVGVRKRQLVRRMI